MKGMEGNLDLESLEVCFFLKTSSAEFKVDCVEVTSLCTVPEERACHSALNQKGWKKDKIKRSVCACSKLWIMRLNLDWEWVRVPVEFSFATIWCCSSAAVALHTEVSMWCQHAVAAAVCFHTNRTGWGWELVGVENGSRDAVLFDVLFDVLQLTKEFSQEFCQCGWMFWFLVIRQDPVHS